MTTFDLDDGDGYIEVKARDADGSAVAVRLDVWRAFNTLVLLEQQHPEDAVARGDAWVDWLTSQGVPPVSHRAAARLADAIVGEVDGQKKTPAGGSPSADSPASTGSTPSTSPPPAS